MRKETFQHRREDVGEMLTGEEATAEEENPVDSGGGGSEFGELGPADQRPRIGVGRPGSSDEPRIQPQALVPPSYGARTRQRANGTTAIGACPSNGRGRSSWWEREGEHEGWRWHLSPFSLPFQVRSGQVNCALLRVEEETYRMGLRCLGHKWTGFKLSTATTWASPGRITTQQRQLLCSLSTSYNVE